MKFLKAIADAILKIADAVSGPRTYCYPPARGFEDDQRQLRGDVRAAGADMSRHITKCGDH